MHDIQTESRLGRGGEIAGGRGYDLATHVDRGEPMKQTIPASSTSLLRLQALCIGCVACLLALLAFYPGGHKAEAKA